MDPPTLAPERQDRTEHGCDHHQGGYDRSSSRQATAPDHLAPALAGGSQQFGG
jgi:hypothetical protein